MGVKSDNRGNVFVKLGVAFDSDLLKLLFKIPSLSMPSARLVNLDVHLSTAFEFVSGCHASRVFVQIRTPRLVEVHMELGDELLTLLTHNEETCSNITGVGSTSVGRTHSVGLVP